MASACSRAKSIRGSKRSIRTPWFPRRRRNWIRLRTDETPLTTILRAAFALMPSHNARNFVRVLRQRVATPDHVQIRPDQKIIEAVDAPRRFAVDIANSKRRTDRDEDFS